MKQETIEKEHQILENTPYRIIAAHSGKSLEVKNCGLKEFDPVVQNEIADVNHQKFYFRKTELGFYKIIAIHTNNPLEMKYSTLNSEILYQSVEHDTTNQQFKIVPFQDQTYLIQCRHSSKVWDINCASNENYYNVIQYQFHGGLNQQFIIQQLSQ